MPDDSANRRLKIEAHDASRVEWSIYIPLPRGPSVSEAEVSLRLEFPENVYVPHDGWEQVQILARLSSPDEESPAPEPLTVDGLRRSALGVARRLKLLRESIPRAVLALGRPLRRRHRVHRLLRPAGAADERRRRARALDPDEGGRRRLCPQGSRQGAHAAVARGEGLPPLRQPPAGGSRGGGGRAPRLYRVPLTLVVETPAGAERREAVIVLNRRGIARIVPESSARPLPAEPELEFDDGAGLLPQTWRAHVLWARETQRAPVPAGPAPLRERPVERATTGCRSPASSSRTSRRSSFPRTPRGAARPH